MDVVLGNLQLASAEGVAQDLGILDSVCGPRRFLRHNLPRYSTPASRATTINRVTRRWRLPVIGWLGPSFGAFLSAKPRTVGAYANQEMIS